MEKPLISANYVDLAVEISRQMYRHPCRSFEEGKWTLPYLEGKLQEYGVAYDRIPVEQGKTYGLCVKIAGQKDGDGPVILLRGDMDALAGEAASDAGVLQQFSDAFHGCGHHVHTAQVFAMMLWFHENKKKFNGTLIVMFQPAEETPPGGCKDMLKYMTERFGHVYDAAVMYHVTSDILAGRFGLRKGAITASYDTFSVRVIGKEGHSGHPDKAKNPLPVAAELLLLLHEITHEGLQEHWSSKYPELYEWAHSLGLSAASCSELTKFLCGKADPDNPNNDGAVNVISGEVIFNGSIRCHDPVIRQSIKLMIRELCERFISCHDGYQVEVTIVDGYPAVICHDQLVDEFRTVVTEHFGAQVLEEAPRSSGGEDFGYATLYCPTLLVREGVGFPDRENYGLHHRNFRANEEAIPAAMEAMILFLLHKLNR